MSRFRNEALSSWRRPGGELVKRGEEFDADERETAAIIRRHYTFLVPVEVLEAEPVSEPEGGLGGQEEDLTWPLKTPPDVYVKNNPDGPRAALARRILSAGVPA